MLLLIYRRNSEIINSGVKNNLMMPVTLNGNMINFLPTGQSWFLSDCWARPEDYIKDAYKTAGSLRETAETAIRSNPFVVSYTPTNSVAD